MGTYGMENTDDSHLPPRASRDLEYVENSRREIDNTIWQWKFNAIAIRSAADAETRQTRAADDTFPGATFSAYVFIFATIHQHAKHARHEEITGKGRREVDNGQKINFV